MERQPPAVWRYSQGNHSLAEISVWPVYFDLPNRYCGGRVREPRRSSQQCAIARRKFSVALQEMTNQWMLQPEQSKRVVILRQFAIGRKPMALVLISDRFEHTGIGLMD